MILNRKIELDQEEKNEIENEIEAILNRPAFHPSAYTSTVEESILNLFTKKLQEAFDFGFAEGRKTNE